MRAVMLMFDSLNKHMLPNYGCNWVKAPNFKRLEERMVTFDSCYAGSLPCVPARRELHTGRYNFMHRSWGPLEPFDDSMIELMKKNNVYTHLTTDHNHYFEDGGATYHTRYNSWEFARGQEGDAWKGQVGEPIIPESLSGPKLGDLWRQDWVNRQFLKEEENMPLAVTVRRGIEFIERNHEQDRWFLQIEAFDPHEPFFTQQQYKDLYPHFYDGKHFDWPDYAMVTQQPEEIQHMIFEYAALISMCDAYLGKILDAFDRFDLWKDTMLIVNTDHGFLLGEHEWWGKNIQPFYNEIVNIPLFLWNPRYKARGKRSDALVQTIDLAPTLLHYFDIPVPHDMQGRSLHTVLETGVSIREAALFGMHGGHINCTDGRYVYMRAPRDIFNEPLYEYTLMPAHMNKLFDVQEFKGMELSEPFSFMKGCSVMKLKGNTYVNPFLYGDMLFDLQNDPKQQSVIEDQEVEVNMIRHIARLMNESDAPREQFERLGIPMDGVVTPAQLNEQKIAKMKYKEIDLGLNEIWRDQARKAYFVLQCVVPNSSKAVLHDQLKAYIQEQALQQLEEEDITRFALHFLGRQMPHITRILKMFS